MINKPAVFSSVASSGVSFTFVEAVKFGAGNFCVNKLGTVQRLFEFSGTLIEKRRRKFWFANLLYHTIEGFALHCHCNPISFPLNSSVSEGFIISDLFEISGFLYVKTGSPIPFLS